MANADQMRSPLTVLRRVIDDYERGATPRGRFLQEFDDVIARVESISPSCAGRLKTEWWTIEQVFAASMDPELRMPADQEEKTIREALENAKALITVEIESGAVKT